MLKAAVPSPTPTSRRLARPPRMKLRQAVRKAGRGVPRCAVRAGSRASCFHNATTFSTIVSSAAPWMTWISRIWLKSASSAPKASELATMPSSSIT